jgi:CRISPR-associated protein Csm1
MSVQIFLRGKLLGIDEFLISPGTLADAAFVGRAKWASLLAEILPRALLAELGLSKMLLGTSGGDQFLLVLPSEYRDNAGTFLAAAAADISTLSGGAIRTIWASTENLGDWSDIRKRMNEELTRKEGTPIHGASFFTEAAPASPDDEYFAAFGESIRSATSIGWSPEAPARILAGDGKHSWLIDGSAESILFARHDAPERESRPVWGVLRGDVDNFVIRLRRLQNVEEHLQLSLTLKQFFAGELTIRCSMPDFWQKVSILYTAGDDFAVHGDWDALLPLARELQRVFHRFAEENLKDLPGPEGKTITMAIALAPSHDATLASVYEEATANLDLAKSTDKDCIYALGRILEWKQLSDAAELKDDLTSLISTYGASDEFLHELAGLYRETAGTRGGGRRSRAAERPWRYHRRLNRILPSVRDREGQKTRSSIITGFVGRNPANVKLRPGGRVALEWAKLAAGTGEHGESSE